jgi:transcriptional antiterminator RfaH
MGGIDHRGANSKVAQTVKQSAVSNVIKMDQPRWYAVYTKPRSEKKVASRLAEDGINVYCPTYISIRKWSDRRKKVELTVFTSYLFVCVDKADYATVLKDPGVLNYVFHVGKPAVISNTDIERLQRFLGDIPSDERPIVRTLEIGEKARIQQGPLAGLEGLIKDQSRHKAFLVLDKLNLIVEIEKHKLEGF